MFRNELALTQIVDTILGKTYVYEIHRINQSGNYADKLLAALQRDVIDGREVEAVLFNAIKEGKWIHMADVLYRTRASQDLLNNDRKALVQRHYALLIEKCTPLNEEYNGLFLAFLVEQTRQLSLGMKYGIWEDVLRETIQIHDSEVKINPMQSIIDHLYHYLCGNSPESKPERTNIRGDSELLIENAYHMRELRFAQKPTIFGLWSSQRGENTASAGEDDEKRYCILF